MHEARILWNIDFCMNYTLDTLSHNVYNMLSLSIICDRGTHSFLVIAIAIYMLVL